MRARRRYSLHLNPDGCLLVFLLGYGAISVVADAIHLSIWIGNLL